MNTKLKLLGAVLLMLMVLIASCGGNDTSSEPSASPPVSEGDETTVYNDISKLPGKLWIYDYMSEDHPFFSIFQFNDDLTIYEGITEGGVFGYDFLLYSGEELYCAFSVSPVFYPIDLGSYHERLVTDGKLNYYTNSVMQTFEFGEVTFVFEGNTIMLSNGVKLNHLEYTIPDILDVVSYPISPSDNPSSSPSIMRTFVSYENNEFIIEGFKWDGGGAAEPYAEIEVGVETLGGIAIIARGLADADGGFRMIMPQMSAGFRIGTSWMYLIAKTPGKDWSFPVLWHAIFFFPYEYNRRIFKDIQFSNGFAQNY